MPKRKHQSWNFKNPDPETSAYFKARYGGLHPGAVRVAHALRGNSKQWRAELRQRDDYRMAADFCVAARVCESAAQWMDENDRRAEQIARAVLDELCSTAHDGRGDAFRRLAEAIDLLAKEHWADPLSEEIFRYVHEVWINATINGEKCEHDTFMKTRGRFNVERFMSRPGVMADRKTVVKRVRALGYVVQTGAPRKKVGDYG